MAADPSVPFSLAYPPRLMDVIENAEATRREAAYLHDRATRLEANGLHQKAAEVYDQSLDELTAHHAWVAILCIMQGRVI